MELQLFEHLKQVILARLANNKKIPFAELVNCVDRIKENNFLLEHALGDDEKLISLLAISPLTIPAFLNDLQNNEIKFPGYTIPQTATFLPTIESAVYLLAGENTEERIKYLSLLSAQSKLHQSHLISITEPAPGLPFNQSLLSPGTSLLNLLFNKGGEESEFGHNFPAQVLESEHTWQDLIVDYDTNEQLNEVKEWLQYNEILKQQGKPDPFKGGYKCLFHGPPGTGKTMAASLIGKLTDKSVYRIDLSSVVSKYIGETEKNLSKIFDRADQGNWILFFDEADALFGKRSATNNAHDRYANQEVSYLLQRFESYEGVSILATNFKGNIDKAFNRRFHSIVNFKFPEDLEREQLWKVHLPQEFCYEDGIDLKKLARNVKINGAGIYNVLRRCCMKSTIRGSNEVSADDMFESIKLEFAKEGKTI